MNEWLNPKDWYRDGRGRSWTFALSRGEIIRSIERVAATSGTTLDLIACTQLRGDDGLYFSEYSTGPVDSLGSHGTWDYFPRSRSITFSLPNAERRGPGEWSDIFSVNGLVNLQHPTPSMLRHDLSDIGIVHRLRHARTGELRLHPGYDRLFAQLKKELLKSIA